MARVTVEDCVVKVPNRFQLVMLAAQRARDLSVGVALTVERDNDKNPVVALREIAEETLSIPVLEENLIKGLQKHADTDEPGEEAEVLAIEDDFSAATEAEALSGQAGEAKFTDAEEASEDEDIGEAGDGEEEEDGPDSEQSAGED